MRRWLRQPALHFLLLGGLLFALTSLRSDKAGDLKAGTLKDARRPVVISAEHVHQLSADLTRRWGMPPDRGQLEAAVAQAIDEELLEFEARRLALDYGDRSIRQRLIQKMLAVTMDASLGEDALYRTALDLGLDDDVVVRRHLRQKMRLVLQRDFAAIPPTEEDLMDCLERHRDRFLQEESVSFSHVFLSHRLHGVRLAEQADAVATRLGSRSPTSETLGKFSDPFPLTTTWSSRQYSAIVRQFGDTFAGEVLTLEPGMWSRPIESPFGLHLVWVHARTPERLPPLDTVRQQIAHLLEEERSATRLAQGLDQLRRRYEIRVEWPAEIVAAQPKPAWIGS